MTWKDNMRTIIAALGFAMAMQPAFAEQQTLSAYSVLGEPYILDVGPEGLSVGDMFTRRGVKLTSPDGPVLGEYYSQATIVHYDPETATSVRSYFIELITDEGSIFMMDLVEVDHTRPELQLDGHEGAVIGGTGVYSGIHGSYRMIVSDGVSQKEITFTRPTN